LGHNKGGDYVAKKNIYNKKVKPVYRDRQEMDGAVDGQIQFDLNAKTPTLVEVHEKTDNYFNVLTYYQRFRALLDTAGVCARTWYLYREIKTRLDDGRPYGDYMEIVKKNYHCTGHVDEYGNTLTPFMEFKALVEQRRLEYYNAYALLVAAAAGTSVPIMFNDTERKNFLNNFVVIDSRDGDIRRDFYKLRVDRALRILSKPEYVPPESVADMENAFLADENRAYIARHREAREKKREKRHLL